MKSFSLALLILNVLYCALAVVQEGLPGWHMFESVENIDHELRDRDGRLVDVRQWLPRGANLVDRGELRRIVRFVCEKELARAPFTYDERGALRVTLGPSRETCMVHAPR
jgi:hypothetical protein